MSTYKTGNPLGSAAVKDLFDNAENLDFALNSLTALIWTDRLGKTRRSFFGMESAFVTQLTSQESRFNSFIQSSGYQIVGDYTAGPLTLTEYNQLIRYNNELYKLTAATDIPFTTAGNTDETWTDTDAAHFVSVGDAALRQSLASSEKGSGGSMIELEQEGTVQGALTNVFLVSDADNTGASDVTAKIQSWIDKAAAIGGGTVDIPKGTFLCASYSNQVILPGDDGTAAPAWVAAGTDANIAPEATHTMYAALKIPHNVTLRGAGRGLTTLKGNWDPNTTAMTLGSGIGIYVSRDSVGNNGTVNYGLKDITLSNFFIGRLVEGISFASNESNLKVTSCTFSGIFQGMDQHTWSGQVETTGCVAGDVIGGWWLQRNNTQNTAYIPPYPATDVYLLGWADSCPSETLTAGQINGTWGALQNNADTFFDTYFFKSANSATTASGGRLTNNSNNTGTIPQWKGVAGRARTVLSRYGRPINRMDIDNLKLIRQHRTPIYLSNSLGESVISHAYFEGIGLVDNTGSAVSGNLFGIDVVDPLNTSESGVGYMVARGGIGLKNFTASSKNQHAPLSDNADRKNAFYRGTLYVPSGTVSTTQAEIDRASVWDGTTTDIRYLRYADKAFTQPLQFTLGGPTFRYAEGNFTPTLTVNGSLITGLAVSRGHYKRNGNTIMGGVQFSSSAALALSAGQVVIGGLPFTIPSGAIAYHHGQVDVYSHAAAGVNVRPFFNDGATTIKLVTDSKGTDFTASNAPGSVQLLLYVSFTMIISG
ncbi:hypothetical protein R8O77_004225 [Klebsiella michiganensis]|nr:hypothetical protein [Klebsiella michiganensis]HDX8605633.1 hypothetical protein [Klebsiella michiganensis]HEB4989170.1 hypothetical protein [Klebsiella michiganensis]